MAIPQQLSSLTKDLILRDGPQTTLPRLIYGTAWKGDRTAEFVYQAVKCGFRGIDTAAQPRHYNEPLVGEGLRRAIEEGIVSRKDVYLQTKFTSIKGQDPDNLPYDPNAALEDQVVASVQSSLRNLATPDCEPYLDCVVLHSPLIDMQSTMRVWKALSTYVPSKVHHLGISNIRDGLLAQFLSEITTETNGVNTKPAVVQNRFYPSGGWDVELREYCHHQSIVYQAFWTLTANKNLVTGQAATEVARRAGVSREVAFYALVLGLENTAILDGTTSLEHMEEDLRGIEKVGQWIDGSGGNEAWEELLAMFKKRIGERGGT